jgi:outer membrane protein OmpA-like peptidoglycan-associated protein
VSAGWADWEITVPSSFSIIGSLVLAAALAGRAYAQEVPRIPLRAGLTIVTAVHENDGDYESIKTFVSEDAISLRIKYSSESAVPGDILNEQDQYVQYRPHPSNPDLVIEMTNVYRTVLRSDLKTSDHYVRLFPPPPMVPETVPGTTAVGISARLLNEFKSRGAASLTTYYAIFAPQPLSSADTEDGPQPFEGTLTRVEKGDVGLPVIVNGKLVKLPAVHVKGQMLDIDAEFWFLDDPDNPLALRYAFDKVRLNVIRINFPGDGGAMTAADAPDSGIEQSLAKTGHADVYGIYFGFNSDVIRPESEPVLKEIAALMSKHPDWKLHVDGHTDNVGGADFNLALSTRRSAAVKKVLVERYHVGAIRLSPAGFGLSAPKTTNDTLEGRALNRRVELSKE